MSEEDVFEKLLKLMRTMDKMMYANDVEGLNKYIESVNVSEVEPEMMIAVLREPWLFHRKTHNLVAWLPKLIEVHAELIKRGEDVEEMLTGILDQLPEAKK